MKRKYPAGTGPVKTASWSERFTKSPSGYEPPTDAELEIELGEAMSGAFGLLKQEAEFGLFVSLHAVRAACESEIERALVVALLVRGARRYGQSCAMANGKTCISLGIPNNPECLALELQHPIGPYRADIVATVSAGPEDFTSVVVECDGHDFHERTKEQAARDRKRDREMQALGHVVLRFTGAEIWADPLRCASEALDAIEAARRRKGAP